MLLPLRGQRVKQGGRGRANGNLYQQELLFTIYNDNSKTSFVQYFVHCFDVLNIIIIGIKEHTANLG